MPAQRSDGLSHICVVAAGNGSKALYSRVALEPGEVLVTLRISAVLSAPGRHSIQLGVGTHALVDPEAVRFMNHSCEPNVFIAASDMCIRAVRRIAAGDEIRYFYPSTEWSMAEPFECCCGSPRCHGWIAGAADMSAEALAGYELTAHIAGLLATRAALRPASAPASHQASDLVGPSDQGE